MSAITRVMHIRACRIGHDFRKRLVLCIDILSIRGAYIFSSYLSYHFFDPSNNIKDTQNEPVILLIFRIQPLATDADQR